MCRRMPARAFAGSSAFSLRLLPPLVTVASSQALDSWAVGVLIAMIAGGMNKSPFCAEVDWSAGLFTPEAATRAAIFNTQRTLADFLLEVDGGAGGFLFRNGWVVRLLIGLLQVEPSRRMPVYQAYRIAHDAIDSNPQYADEQRPESTRTAAANQPPAAVAEPTKADADSAAAVPAPGAASSAPAVTPESGRTPTQTKGSTGAKSAAPSPRRGDGRPNTVEGDASTLGLELSRFRKLATTSSSSEPFVKSSGPRSCCLAPPPPPRMPRSCLGPEPLY